MAGDAVLIAEIDAVCDRARHEAAICQIHLTVVLLDDLEFDLVVEELEVRPGRLFLDIGVLILVGHSKTPFISHVLDYIIGKHQSWIGTPSWSSMSCQMSSRNVPIG